MKFRNKKCIICDDSAKKAFRRHHFCEKHYDEIMRTLQVQLASIDTLSKYIVQFRNMLMKVETQIKEKMENFINDRRNS
ncbi:MAG: hypothetical protein ACE5ES_00865 [Candidatus Nanoarchaeia archaeon]